METQSPPPKSTTGFTGYLPIIVVVVLVAVGVAIWYHSYAKYIRSDDALIAGNDAQIASQIAGRIVVLDVREGDTVSPNQLLVRLDTRALLDKQNEVNAQIAEAKTGLNQARASYKYNQEQLIVRQLALDMAQKNYTRNQALFKGQAIALEQLQESQNSFLTAKTELESAKEVVAVSKAQIQHQAAAVNSAAVQLQSISTQLSYASIYSPGKGIVAKKWLQKGDVVEPAQTILTVAIDSTRWVEANIEETKLRYIDLNEKVQITVDAYPNEQFYGHVLYIGSMAASQFSLIPASNAAGNFTKVVQRIPVKISVDSVANGKSLTDFPLRIGMSAEVKAKKR